MNILLVKSFVRMRELIASNKDLAARLEKLERGHDRTASVIEVLVEDIDRLALEVRKALPEPKKRRIGFRLGNDDTDHRQSLNGVLIGLRPKTLQPADPCACGGYKIRVAARSRHGRGWRDGGEGH